MIQIDSTVGASAAKSKITRKCDTERKLCCVLCAGIFIIKNRDDDEMHKSNRVEVEVEEGGGWWGSRSSSILI